MSERDRLFSWLRALAAARSTSHLCFAGGEGFANADFPAAHDHNFAWLDSAAALPEAERFLTEQHIEHRLFDVRDELAAEAAAALEGYEQATEVLMAWPGDQFVPAEAVAGDILVEEIELAERCRVAAQGWRGVVPEEEARQLGYRAETLTAACQATFLAVRDQGGQVVSRLDVYVRDGVAQLEELITDPALQRRGLGTALLSEGLRRALDNRVFLVAEAQSEPAMMYRRLGFQDVGQKVSFTRS